MEESINVAALAEQVNATQVLVENLWTVVAASLVLFMQAGFCFVEAGSVRTKNNINVAVKNIIDLCATGATYFLVGYSFMFGASSLGFIGEPDVLLQNLPADDWLAFLFQFTFCATAATIVSGAIAERCRFLPYVLVSLAIGLFIYPVFGHWVWGGGWLSQLGFHDFAGSSVVHMVGGAVGLAGIQVLGPRLGRFGPDGSSKPFPASSMPQVAVGVVILTFGWIGFNGGSASFGPETPIIIVNTLLAACFGGLAAMLFTWANRGLAGIEVILNGVLGGLVAVTACADVITPLASMLVGLLGGLAVVGGTSLLERFQLDDAVGAVPVHLIAGAVGVLLTPLVMIPEMVPENGRIASLGVQAVGVVACFAWAYGLGLLVWWVVGRISPLRVGEIEEKFGLNYTEHQVPDPLGELTTAVGRVARGEPIQNNVMANLDDAGYGALGRALSVIMERKPGTVATGAWMRELDQVRFDLDAQLQQQKQANGRCVTAMQECGQSLQHILDYLAENKEASVVVPLLHDLLSRSHQQMAEATDGFENKLQQSLLEPLNAFVKRLQGA